MKQLLLLAAAAAFAQNVRIDSGELAGLEKEGVRVFRGIPYAAPPVGGLRWKPPAPPAPWTGVREAKEPGAGCMQRARGNARLSEDCLYLNVYTAARPGEKRPVMFWIHGGAFVSGSGALYDGTNLARQGVVVVTINYRLGALGFFAHPALSAESPKNVSGNYGLLDMIAALEWTKRNIRAFGGDPKNVTIFGESAGAAAVHYLMGSPLAKGLFAKAIMESNPSAPPRRHLKERWYNVDPAEQVGERVAAALGAADLAALRAAAPEAVMAAMAKPGVGPSGTLMSLEPAIDGYVVPDDLDDVFEAGRQSRVPLLVGANSDEGSLSAGVAAQVKDEAAFRAMAERFYPGRSAEILKHYPAAAPEEFAAAVRLLSGDRSFVTAARWMAAQHARVAPAYLYFFSYVDTARRGRIPGAAHAAEIPYVFNTPMGALAVGKFSEEDARVAQAMSAAWVAFARTGKPQHPGIPAWPAYRADTDRYLEFGEKIAAASGLRRGATDTLAGIHNQMRAARRNGAPAGK
jgi:para-nitrobenzyl esterase